MSKINLREDTSANMILEQDIILQYLTTSFEENISIKGTEFSMHLYN